MMDHDGHQQEPLSTEQPSTEQLGQWEAPQSDFVSAEKAPKLLQAIKGAQQLRPSTSLPGKGWWSVGMVLGFGGPVSWSGWLYYSSILAVSVTTLVVQNVQRLVWAY